MRYDIIYSAKAQSDIRKLKAHIRAKVKDAIETYLLYEPAKVSKSRIKRMRDLASPRYRLRVGDIRIYYDISSEMVVIHAILTKEESADWLNRVGDTQ